MLLLLVFLCKMFRSGTKKEPKPKLLSPDIFWWGGGLPREGVGAKKFGMSLETQGIKLFWRDIPGFCRDIPEAPEKFEKKKFGFNSRPLLDWRMLGDLEQHEDSWQCGDYLPKQTDNCEVEPRSPPFKQCSGPGQVQQATQLQLLQQQQQQPPSQQPPPVFGPLGLAPPLGSDWVPACHVKSYQPIAVVCNQGKLKGTN